MSSVVNNKDTSLEKKFLYVENHSTYQKHIKKLIDSWLGQKISDSYLQAAFILYSLNFDTVRPLLQSLYADNCRGRTPIDPVIVFRALVLMELLQYTSITKFAKDLKVDQNLAALTGSICESQLSIGLFYLFMHRIETGGYSFKDIVNSTQNGVVRSLKQEKLEKKIKKNKC